MATTIKEERLRWVLPIVKKDMKLKEVSKVCPHSKRSLERWVSVYKKKGEEGLEPKSTRPKTQPKETSIRIKEEVVALRKKTKLCALKLKWKLEKKGIILHKNTVHKFIKEEGLTRTYRVRKVKRKYLKIPLQKGQLVEIDVKYVPKKIDGKQYFQYTAIDVASRWRHLNVYDNQTNDHSICFLKEVIKIFPHRIHAVKTDNGSIFTNYYTGTNKRSDVTVKTIHSFDVFCQEQRIIHYLIDPGKPAQNGTVERSHREDQEKFYDQHEFISFKDLQKKMKKWNIYYNNLEHCGLNGKTPIEVLNQV
jgi:transposase